MLDGMASGDALNLLLIIDKEMMRKMYRLSPHYGILSLQEPSKVSGCVGMPKPVVSTIDNWLKKGPKVPVKPEYMEWHVERVCMLY